MSDDRPERNELSEPLTDLCGMPWGRIPIDADALTPSGEPTIEVPAGIPREVIAAVIAQLEREAPVYQADFQELYGAALEAMASGDLRPVKIPETFGPED